MNILILMTENTKDFEEKNCSSAEYLTELKNQPIVQRILEQLNDLNENIICIIRKADREKYFPDDTLKYRVIEIPGETKGDVCSALFAIDDINSEEELFILDGAQFIKSGLLPALNSFRERKLDGGIITIDTLNPQYSSVLLDENNMVIQTSENHPISHTSSTGCYYYKHGKEFVRAAFKVIEQDVNTQGKYYISSTFNEMILEQKRIGIFEIPEKDYISFSTYQMFENYAAHKEKK